MEEKIKKWLKPVLFTAGGALVSGFTVIFVAMGTLAGLTVYPHQFQDFRFQTRYTCNKRFLTDYSGIIIFFQ